MGINLLKGMGKAYQAFKRNKTSKKVFETARGLQHPVIKSVKPKKNLKKREDIVHHVDKHGKKPHHEKLGISKKEYDDLPF